MTGVHPYVGWTSPDRSWRLWGLAGYGEGRAALRESGSERAAERSDLEWTSAALGASRELWQSEEFLPSGRTVLRARGDALTARMEVAGNAAAGGLLDPLTVQAQRLRLALEASHEVGLSAGGLLTPSLSVGVRGDFGDAEEATAGEFGLGLAYSGSGSGLVIIDRPLRKTPGS